MDISSKVANFVAAVALTALPVSGQVIQALPYIQFAAASVAVINNTAQIADRLKSSDK
ncbi:hypothetical protein BH23CYA1_BH23CYA1_07160 [soil metagenome]